MTKVFRCAALIVPTLTFALSPAFCAAQTYPSKPIRIIVPSTPGGSVDMLARTIGARLGERWGQQVVVDNRSGAGGVIAGELTARAAPDGYTLIMATISSMATNVSLARNLPYDPIRDFAPITHVASQQIVLLAGTNFAAKTLQDLITMAKAKPGQITFGTAGNGTGGHLAGELLKLMAGIDLTHIPYKGSSPALIDVISGQVPLTPISINTALPSIKTGRVRALAVSGAHRSQTLPDTPTMNEAGVKGYESYTWYGMLAPKATARAVITKLNAETVAILKIPEVRERLLADGAEPIGNTPEQFGTFIQSEIDKWGRVIKAAGLKAE